VSQKFHFTHANPPLRVPSINLPRNDVFQLGLKSDFPIFRFPNPVARIPNLKSHISNPPTDSCSGYCKSPLPSRQSSVFARAPMILLGMPSGRPCALAKTPARTRKNCDFSLPPSQINRSDNVYFHSPLSPSFIDRPPSVWFCLLNTYISSFTLAPRPRSPAFRRPFLNL